MAYKFNPISGEFDIVSSGSTIPDVQTVTSAATVTPTSSNDEVVITAQAVALALANPTGTPAQGQAMTIRIKDNGTARAITYDTQYRAVGVSLPTSTTVSKTLYLGLIYNSTDTKWDVVGVSLEGADPVTDSGWVDYSATSTIVGWSTRTTTVIKYRIVGKQLFCFVLIVGTSNSTTTSITLPNAFALTINFDIPARNTDNGSATIGFTRLQNSSATILFGNATSGTTWTASGTKAIQAQFFYEIA